MSSNAGGPLALRQSDAQSQSSLASTDLDKPLSFEKLPINHPDYAKFCRVSLLTPSKRSKEFPEYYGRRGGLRTHVLKFQHWHTSLREENRMAKAEQKYRDRQQLDLKTSHGTDELQRVLETDGQPETAAEQHARKRQRQDIGREIDGSRKDPQLPFQISLSEMRTVETLPSSSVNSARALQQTAHLVNYPAQHYDRFARTNNLLNQPFTIKPLRNATSWIDQEDIGEPLKQVTGYILNYSEVVYENRARMPHRPFLELPLFTSKSAQESETNILVNAVRDLIGVTEGVDIATRATDLSLQEHIDDYLWFRGITSLLFGKFVFRSESIWGSQTDADSLRQTMVDAGLTSKDAEAIIQSSRLNILDRNLKPLDNLRSAFIRQLNSAMSTLTVGYDTEAQRMHEKIATVAVDLKARLSAHSGHFDMIAPTLCNKFNPRYHELEFGELEFPVSSNDMILITVMIGVTFKSSKGEEIVLRRAIVRLWPRWEQASGIAEGHNVHFKSSSPGEASHKANSSRKTLIPDPPEDWWRRGTDNKGRRSYP